MDLLVHTALSLSFVFWHQVDQPSLELACGDKRAKACFQMEKVNGQDFCHIYTLPRWTYEETKRVSDLHRLLGHEFRHCVEGKWHGDEWNND